MNHPLVICCLKTAKPKITSQVAKLMCLCISCHLCLGLSRIVSLCPSFSKLSPDDIVETENTYNNNYGEYVLPTYRIVEKAFS